MPVQPIPAGYHSVTPYLIVDGAARAIEFYVRAFGAVEVMRVEAGGGKLGHAEIKIGDSTLMLADEHPEMGFKGPKAYGGSPISLAVYVPDVDATFARALSLGAKALRPVANQFYGDRSGTLADPFGHVWNIGTHVEDVPPDELARRSAQQHKK